MTDHIRKNRSSEGPDADRGSVSVTDVSKTLGRGSPVLGSLSFEIQRGQIAAITGPNGVGKSLFLSILIGDRRPDGGEVSIFGAPPREARIGMVWQQTYASLYPWLSAGENAGLSLRLAGTSRDECATKIDELAEKLGFDLPLDRRPYELSGGEQQKVCILRAVAAEPDVLIMDEPLSAVSPDAVRDLLRDIQVIHRELELTTILVTHSREHSLLLADVIIPFPSKPVFLDASALFQVACPYDRPRPTSWMYESGFQAELERLRHPRCEGEST